MRVAGSTMAPSVSSQQLGAEPLLQQRLYRRMWLWMSWWLRRCNTRLLHKAKQRCAIREGTVGGRYVRVRVGDGGRWKPDEAGCACWGDGGGLWTSDVRHSVARSQRPRTSRSTWPRALDASVARSQILLRLSRFLHYIHTAPANPVRKLASSSSSRLLGANCIRQRRQYCLHLLSQFARSQSVRRP